MLVPTSPPTYLGAQGIVDALPGAIITPNPEVMVDAFPLRIVFGQHAPLSATDQNVQDRIDDLAHIQAAWPATGFGLWEQVFDILYTGKVWMLRNDWKFQARSVSNSIRCSRWAVVRHVSNAARNSGKVA